MKIEDTEVYGFRKAIAKAMRNPKNSWDKNDSVFGPSNLRAKGKAWRSSFYGPDHSILAPEAPFIGPLDLVLAKKLIKGGSEHRKFLRQIMIWVDFTLPRYVWTEVDTYKVATVRNSCSTMHKLTDRQLQAKDFEYPLSETALEPLNNLIDKICQLSILRSVQAKEESNKLHCHLKATLPEGYLQKATMTFSYETAMSMFRQRRAHRLPEWKYESEKYSICKWIADLPYMKEFLEL